MNRGPDKPVTSAPNSDAEIAVRVDGISKRYVLRHKTEDGSSYASLREDVSVAARAFGRKVLAYAGRRRAKASRPPVEEFWALDDVSFEVKRGEVVGIVGRNGAGKSTLLKILSQITEPTKGRAVINGRVASLLEVGTGFHPELTGRENIFLNGAILGLAKREIDARFTDIVTFAGIEKFLDTPVKRYSSGMYVRLAFAVAAHLDPEILIIDEVLAVGDAEFQAKCLGAISRMGASGRTVLFVSHNIAAVSALTDRVIILEGGRLTHDLPTREGVVAYLKGLQAEFTPGQLESYRRERRRSGYVDVTGISVSGSSPGTARPQVGDSIEVEIEFEVFRPITDAFAFVYVLNEQMSVIAVMHSSDAGVRLTAPPGIYKIRCAVDGAPLMPGDYFLTVGFNQSPSELAWEMIEGIPGFRVEGDHCRPWLENPDRGGLLLLSEAKWSVSAANTRPDAAERGAPRSALARS
jgi:lipopolysaccharide transport system ATP-binding protein